MDFEPKNFETQKIIIFFFYSFLGRIQRTLNNTWIHVLQALDSPKWKKITKQILCWRAPYYLTRFKHKPNLKPFSLSLSLSLSDQDPWPPQSPSLFKSRPKTHGFLKALLSSDQDPIITFMAMVFKSRLFLSQSLFSHKLSALSLSLSLSRSI